MNLVVSLLSEVQAAGGTAIARGEKLRVQAPQPLPVELIAALRAHKADVLVALARAGNTNVSPVHEESEWTADDWLAYFDVRADDFERDCKLDRAEAELRAFKITVVHWMNRNRFQIRDEIYAQLAATGWAGLARMACQYSTASSGASGSTTDVIDNLRLNAAVRQWQLWPRLGSIRQEKALEVLSGWKNRSERSSGYADRTPADTSWKNHGRILRAGGAWRVNTLNLHGRPHA